MYPRCSLSGEDDELLGGVGQPLPVRGHPLEQVVDQGQPTTRVALLGQRACDGLGHVPPEDVWDVDRIHRFAPWREAGKLGEDCVEAQCPEGLVDTLGQRLGHAGAFRSETGAPLWHAARTVPDERVHMIDVRASKPSPVQLLPADRRSQERHSAGTRPRQTEGRSSRT